MKCEICGKDIEIKDRYTPIRYKITIEPSIGLSMLTNLRIYKNVCQRCGNEIKRFMADMQEDKTTQTELEKFLADIDRNC